MMQQDVCDGMYVLQIQVTEKKKVEMPLDGD